VFSGVFCRFLASPKYKGAMVDLLTRGEALISDCGLYRYWLRRQWDEGKEVCFIMLNPSTADAMKDDPTVRKCVGFARGWGYTSLLVLNLFNYRSKTPADLKKVSDPIGSDAAYYIDRAVASDLVIAAWGINGGYLDRDKKVFAQLRSAGVKLQCLRVSNEGFPYHPLYLPWATQLMNYEGRK
jgi:hypothetical protein